jgi:hypothetical protein
MSSYCRLSHPGSGRQAKQATRGREPDGTFAVPGGLIIDGERGIRGVVLVSASARPTLKLMFGQIGFSA